MIVVQGQLCLHEALFQKEKKEKEEENKEEGKS